ncbi:hypothetical protein DsansV1_C06g0067601 [Dioscorea sansibarensis]
MLLPTLLLGQQIFCAGRVVSISMLLCCRAKFWPRSTLSSGTRSLRKETIFINISHSMCIPTILSATTSAPSIKVQVGGVWRFGRRGVTSVE